VAFSAGGDGGSGQLESTQQSVELISEKLAPLPCGLMTPKGNSRANGISERESNDEANCEADWLAIFSKCLLSWWRRRQKIA
jgi:hypothetical protein